MFMTFSNFSCSILRNLWLKFGENLVFCQFFTFAQKCVRVKPCTPPTCVIYHYNGEIPVQLLCFWLFQNFLAQFCAIYGWKSAKIVGIWCQMTVFAQFNSRPNRACHRLVSYTVTTVSFQCNFYVFDFLNIFLLNFAQFAVENQRKSHFLSIFLLLRKNVSGSNRARHRLVSCTITTVRLLCNFYAFDFFKKI